MYYDTVILIPAYKPDEKLIELINNLTIKDTFKEIIVVNDGSGYEYQNIFNAVLESGKCTLLVHKENRGKGQAIKTGLQYCLDNYGSDFAGVVTADSDGQHTPEDIKNIANQLAYNKDKLIIGTRKFGKDTPLRSKFGNYATTFVYWLINKVKISDTQTGLRGIPASFMEKLITINGDRYEYEMNVLLNLHKINLGVVEVPIETIYIEDNKSSHFNPIKDSIRIYSQIIKFSFSSIVSFIVDYAIYLAIVFLTSKVKLAYITGRVLSSFLNFFLNKKVVFKSKTSSNGLLKEIISYYVLFTINLFLGVILNSFIINIGITDKISKLFSDIIIFFLSYFVQKKIIFKNKK